MDKDLGIYLVQTTLSDRAQAEALARDLVASRLAACVNISPSSVSIYPWEGQIQAEEECVLTIKTTHSKMADLKAYIDQHHPFEVPELLAVPVVDGLPAYVAWVNDWMRD